MTNSINLASVSQSFVVPTNSISTAINNSSFCGPFEYSIVEAYSFIIVTAGNISLQSNLMTDIGTYTATLEVKLTNYSGVTPKTIEFSVELLHPC
jgi:hypothetical protein